MIQRSPCDLKSLHKQAAKRVFTGICCNWNEFKLKISIVHKGRELQGFDSEESDFWSEYHFRRFIGGDGACKVMDKHGPVNRMCPELHVLSAWENKSHSWMSPIILREVKMMKGDGEMQDWSSGSVRISDARTQPPFLTEDVTHQHWPSFLQHVYFAFCRYQKFIYEHIPEKEEEKEASLACFQQSLLKQKTGTFIWLFF